ncbi:MULTISPECIES: TerB family tellurite resistance protein [Flavobacterium]|uniref:TerB family tellurite resistance protein n=1 Tax=Flavobacterium covae TaxID=2906076 RepID=A0ABW8PH77_9FLAO|nr:MULTISPECIES: TerB family tellurite resistance protein [Flavobacterium]AMA49300.1 excinuclease ABC subunit B [Flavobacterium covae]AND65480.1 excinuclease ABC subunit B [Flavobacterium covae]MCJ1806802.1 TerB family tellurite resistance protein [Flavobacterium covae]MCJ1809273.1 TerB family tellurite resistance protein [Flavobacterium covae]OWP81337.1 excinuclease ABC subunit B [Flavobacterium covae]
MSIQKEKINLLQEMIAFAVIDGELHDREYDFLWIVAQELEIDKAKFLELFNLKEEKQVLKDEFQRVLQFYRLALLMHCDGVLHTREKEKIFEIGINMGLNPSAMKRVLYLMEKSPNQMLEAEVVIGAFQEQLN